MLMQPAQITPGLRFWPVDKARLDEEFVLVQLVKRKFAVDIDCDPVKDIGAVVGFDGLVDGLSEVVSDR
jgi:hypothetical protein